MSDNLMIWDTEFIYRPLPEGTVLKPVDLFDGKPFFLVDGPDGEPVLMMNMTKQDLEDHLKFWTNIPDTK